MEKRAYEKLEILKQNIRELGKLAVAYSSGVDSTFLLQTAKEVLGENTLAVTVRSEAFPGRETEEAEGFCRAKNIPQIILDFKPLELDGFAKNPKDRCYHCKKDLLNKITNAAEERGIFHVAEGSNMDDLGDYRPGLLAVEELGILSPLREAGLYKEEIRFLSKDMGLPTWNKPSYACLASRFVYGEEITLEKLERVEQAEDFLMEQGFWQMRVRVHGNLARIEVLPENLGQFLEEEFRRKVCEKFRELGFSYVSLDLQGYRTGSMNV
ncbi:MAG: ATP-dependent sacrificial sulfur transferase LarE [Roseburia sp.]|nr:ATP-dependent sacrificial sulfur transferase LarE [Roseburia sp.]